jgi:hypothetical protein
VRRAKHALGFVASSPGLYGRMHPRFALVTPHTPQWIRVGRYHDWGDPDETPEDARATGRQAAARQGSDSAAGANVPGDADVNAARDEL